MTPNPGRISGVLSITRLRVRHLAGEGLRLIPAFSVVLALAGFVITVSFITVEFASIAMSRRATAQLQRERTEAAIAGPRES